MLDFEPFSFTVEDEQGPIFHPRSRRAYQAQRRRRDRRGTWASRPWPDGP
jgi:hypothetical protein